MGPQHPDDLAELAYDDDPSADLRAEEPPDEGVPGVGDPIHLNSEVPF